VENSDSINSTMPKCCVINCKSGYDAHCTPKEIQWFHFPKTKALLEKWEFKVHRANFKITKHTQICSRHFLKEDFVPDEENVDKFKRKYKKRHLKVNAVPSVDMCTSHLQESHCSQPPLTNLQWILSSLGLLHCSYCLQIQ